MKIQEPKKLSPSESGIITDLKEKHHKIVQTYNDMLAVNASKARALAIKIEALEKQITFFEKRHQDLFEKQSSVKKKSYL